MSDATECTDCDVELIKGEIAAQQAAADHRNDVDLETVKAGIAAQAADSAAVEAADSAAEAQDLAHRTLYHTKIADLATGSIDRARDSAKFIQTASAALIAAYTGLLGLVFSTTSRTLPVRGVYAALFLGLAVALSVAYLAFLRGSSASVGAYEPGASYADTQLARSINLIVWTNAVVSTRAWALRASVLCLALGVAFVPAAFIGPSASAASAPGAPVPPTIPSAVPAPIASSARQLFDRQVADYLAAVDASSGAKRPTPPKTCTDFFSSLRTCGWATERAVEDQFRRLALLGLLVVIVGATAAGIADSRHRTAIDQLPSAADA
jgi:hypothetical protein